MGITDQTIQWHGMAVSIRHVANWSGTRFDHIEVRSTTPERPRFRSPKPATARISCTARILPAMAVRWCSSPSGLITKPAARRGRSICDHLRSCPSFEGQLLFRPGERDSTVFASPEPRPHPR